MHKISVVIPVYNCEAFVEEAVESVLNQTYPIHEVIVVNDGSTDATTALLDRFARDIAYLELPANEGICQARNIGIDAATGDWIAFLDADDIWARNKIELQVREIRDDVGFVFSGKESFWDDGSRQSELCLYSPTDADSPMESLLDHFFASPSTVLVRTDLLRRCNCFQSDMELTDGDYDLWIKLATITRFTLVRRPLVRFRRRRGSTTSKKGALESAMSHIKPLIICRDLFRQHLGISNKQFRLIVLMKFSKAFGNHLRKRNLSGSARIAHRCLGFLIWDR